MYIDTKKEFIQEYSKFAIPVALESCQVAVVQHVVRNCSPCLELSIGVNASFPEGLDGGVYIGFGDALDNDEEGREIVAKDAVVNLRKLADAIEQWQLQGRETENFLDDFFGPDEEDEDEEIEWRTVYGDEDEDDDD